MADLFFLLAGIVLFFKKEVHISRKRVLTGRPVKILAVLYVLPFLASFLGGVAASTLRFDLVYASWVGLLFAVLAVGATLYFIFFHKGHLQG